MKFIFSRSVKRCVDVNNLHDKTVLGFTFAETGFVYYKINSMNIPYIVQYLVNLKTNPPGLIHIPLTKTALALDNYCIPRYIENAWEWIDGRAHDRGANWRPDIDYIYNCLNTPLFSFPGDRLTFPLTYSDSFWRYTLSPQAPSRNGKGG